MNDLISRQDALKPFCIAPDGTRIPEVDCDNFPVEFSVEFIKKHLLSLPSADAVEVVRCKDCKYWKEGKCWNLKGLNKTDGIVNADDFCSYGERSEKPNNSND